MLFNKKNQVITALVTPFLENDEIDYQSLSTLINYQIKQGVDSIVLLGTTGESVTMNSMEKDKLVNYALDVINKGVPVIIGAGTNCTKTTIENHKKAHELGVYASLIVTPYYNNPSSSNIVNHYQAINDACDFPFILYHVPSRTNSKLTIYDAKKILEMKNCIGIKDATGQESWQSLFGIKNKLMYSGDDCSAHSYCQSGGDGVISVLSNFSPLIMRTLLETNRAIYQDLCTALTCDTNPIPIKFVLKVFELIKNDIVRKPLMMLNSAEKENLLQAFKEVHIEI